MTPAATGDHPSLLSFPLTIMAVDASNCVIPSFGLHSITDTGIEAVLITID